MSNYTHDTAKALELPSQWVNLTGKAWLMLNYMTDTVKDLEVLSQLVNKTGTA